MDYIFTAKESVVATNASDKTFVNTTILTVLMNNVGDTDFAGWEDIGNALNEVYDTASLDVQVGSWKQIALLTNESENLIPTPTPNPKIYCDLMVKFCESEEVEPKYVSFSVVGELFTTGDTYLPTVIVNWMQDRFDVSKTYVILSATCRVVYEQESEEEE